MRQSKARTTAGEINRRTLISKQTLIFAACSFGALWVAYTFSQEAVLSHRLNVQENQLRAENAQLQTQNAQYQRQILSMASGSGIEEQARLNGYARPDEKVFLIVPAPVSRAAAGPRVALPAPVPTAPPGARPQPEPPPHPPAQHP